MSSEEAQDWFEDPPPRRKGVHALITRGTRLLMVSRPYREPVPTWGLPGGSAAANELTWDALSRLLSERLTLKATVGDLLVVDHVPERPGELHEGTNYAYRVDIPVDAEPIVTEAGRFGEARWVERSATGDLAVDHSLRRIEQCLIADDTGQVIELFRGLPTREVAS
ncbi:NUDIX domain-containing protein [Streptomyces sp. NPDC051554]|uniref:NUDIX domain-containing protein n=1 Tax=Streptomyces sp. NPDC051554 TaxID=3365656 RepID=UPI00379DC5CC